MNPVPEIRTTSAFLIGFMTYLRNEEQGASNSDFFFSFVIYSIICFCLMKAAAPDAAGLSDSSLQTGKVISDQVFKTTCLGSISNFKRYTVFRKFITSFKLCACLYSRFLRNCSLSCSQVLNNKITELNNTSKLRSSFKMKGKEDTCF